jgi:chromosome segregation ATPase
MIDFLLQPALFFGFLCILFVVSFVLVMSEQQRQQKQSKRKDDEISKSRQSIFELESLLSCGDAKRAEMTKEHEAVRVELSRSVKEWETAFAEGQQLKAQVTSLQKAVADGSALLLEETRQKQELAARRINLELEIARLKKELELAAQMHEGLKGQYSELEDQFSQQVNPPLDEQKKNALPMSPPDLQKPGLLGGPSTPGEN